MDFSKIKNNKVLKWALIISLPTVLVAGYYGYKYYKDKKGKKENESENEIEKETKVGADSEVDKNDEFEYHKIVLPTSPQKELNLINVLKAKDIKYKLLGIKTVSGIRNEPILEYSLEINKKDFEEFDKIVNDIIEILKKDEKIENN